MAVEAKPELRRLAVDVDRHTYEAFKKTAERNGRSIAGELRHVAKHHIKANPQIEKAA